MRACHLWRCSLASMFAVDCRFCGRPHGLQTNPAKSDTLPPNIKRMIHHGRLLARPASQPENTQSAVAYELGRCLQFDRDHCLIVASMDEQGGGDLCVGNDCFVIQKLSDVAAEKAIPLNRAVKDYDACARRGENISGQVSGVGDVCPAWRSLARRQASSGSRHRRAVFRHVDVSSRQDDAR